MKIILLLLSLFFFLSCEKYSKSDKNDLNKIKYKNILTGQNVFVDSLNFDTIFYKTFETRIVDGDSTKLFSERTVRISTKFADTVLHGWLIKYHSNGVIKSKDYFVYGSKDGWCSNFRNDSSVISSTEYVIVGGAGSNSTENRKIVYDSLGRSLNEKCFYFEVNKDTGDTENYGGFRIVVRFNKFNYKENLRLVVGNYSSFNALIDSSNYQMFMIDSNDQYFDVIPQVNESGEKCVRGYIKYDDRKLWFSTEYE